MLFVNVSNSRHREVAQPLQREPQPPHEEPLCFGSTLDVKGAIVLVYADCSLQFYEIPVSIVVFEDYLQGPGTAVGGLNDPG